MRSGAEVEADLAPLQFQTAPRRASRTFDRKPLSTGLRPAAESAWAVRTLIRLPAMVFQIANLHPLPPAAAAVGLLLLDDLGAAERT